MNAPEFCFAPETSGAVSDGNFAKKTKFPVTIVIGTLSLVSQTHLSVGADGSVCLWSIP